LGHDDVEPDRQRLIGGDPVDERGEPAARPWPLAYRFEGVLVDPDDRHRLEHALSRRPGLIGVEERKGRAGGGRLGRQIERRGGDEERRRGGTPAPGPQDAHQPRGGTAHHTSSSSPSYAAITSRLWPSRVISSKRRVSLRTLSTRASSNAGS